MRVQIFHRFTQCALILCVSGTLLIWETRAAADTGSTSWMKWRSAKTNKLCQGAPKNITVGSRLASNYMVRGVPIFHRPIEDLLAQKIGIIPEVRWQYSQSTEFSWDTAFALQARTLTRAEIRHAESVQNLRIHHCIPLTEKWALLTAGNLSFAFEDTFGLRSEAAISVLRELLNISMELGVIHHQAVLGDSAVKWATTHTHLEFFRSEDSRKWRIMPYVRVSAERQTFDWSTPTAIAYQLGMRWAYRLDTFPLGLTWSANILGRVDLKEVSANLTFGLNWHFAHD